MNEDAPATCLVIDGLGKCLAFDGVDTSYGCPDVLSALGSAIHKYASDITRHCDLGTLESVELHTRSGQTVHIQPSASEELTLRF